MEIQGVQNSQNDFETEEQSRSTSTSQFQHFSTKLSRQLCDQDSVILA